MSFLANQSVHLVMDGFSPVCVSHVLLTLTEYFYSFVNLQMV
ncbi:hypothetical protein PhaeoP88_02566 [Phaeobacter inhibens]|uniref:Uncharacterized protein n=1 Tax=Phaeobacter inhibens TaxID=221822 RepID=A0A2I7KBD9_9RHOB|nr:hypothetical protein PhaeoP88_02566 [Phaeobacter inhibens]